MTLSQIQPTIFEKEKEKENEISYWTRLIHEEVKKTFKNVTYNSIMWKIKLNVKPCNTAGVRDLYHRLVHEKKDPRSPYHSFAHAFYARIKNK